MPNVSPVTKVALMEASSNSLTDMNPLLNSGNEKSQRLKIV